MRIKQKNLIVQLQFHDEKALEYLVREHGVRLISIIRKHLFTLPHLQLECFLDTVLSIWDHMDCFFQQNEFENWIGSVARYRCLEYLKNYQQEATIAWLIEKEIAEEKEVMINSLEEPLQELFYRFYTGEKLEPDSREYRKYAYHNIYELLNAIDTDIYEYEKEPLTEEEMKQILQELRMKRKDRKHKKQRKFFQRYAETLFRRSGGKQTVTEA